MIIQHRAGAKHIYIPGGSLGVRACSAGEIGGGGVTSTYSVQFDGTNDYILVPDAISLRITTGTLSAWIKAPTPVGGQFNQVIVKLNSYYMGISDANKLRVYMYGKSSPGYHFGATTLTAGQWYHIAVVVSASNIIGYINGAEDLNISSTGTIDQTTGSLAIGNDTLANWYHGNIDDPRIYNVALSAADVAALAAGQDIQANLIAYWPLEEGSGTTTADLIGGNTGTLTNGPTWHPQPPPQLVPNRITSTAGVVFDGTDDYIPLPASSAYQMGTGDWSVSFWAKSARAYTGGEFPGIIVFQGDGVVISSNAFQILQDDAGVARSTTTISTNVWYHVAATRTGATYKIYIDGVSESLLAGDGPGWGQMATYAINQAYGGIGKFQGVLDDVRIYSRALSATEVAQLCRGQDPATNDPVGWWKLDEGSGTTAVDSGSGGNNGTLTNGPTWATTNLSPWLTP